MAAARAKKLCVAVTGANGYIGSLALPRLLASPRVARVIALDLAEPAIDDAHLSYAPLDLSRASAVEDLTAALLREKVQVLVHLAFFSSPVRDAAFAHEVEAVGTGHVLAACAAASVQSLVMSSTTLVYGALPQNPNLLGEDRPLPFQPLSRYVADKIEAEQQVKDFRRNYPAIRCTVLRLAPVVGPTVDTPISRYLDRSLAPTLFGHDPLVQVVHEDDVAEAILLAVLGGQSTEYNICARGVVPLSAAVRLAGARALPLPLPLATTALRTLNAMGLTNVPTRLLDYLRYLWVADGSKAEHELGFRPHFSTREALLSFAKARGRAEAARG
jgi:UDP-glucose 4-epimerase